MAVIGTVVLILGAAGTISLSSSATILVLALIVAAGLIFGITMVLPIGGADMPVVISLLNALTGTAAAMAGFVIGNPVLIIAGALVGASGSILTNLMATAMNRSILNILAGGFGTGDSTAGAAVGGAGGTVREISADDAAIQLAYAQSVIIVPGYGLAVAQAQHQVRELAELLESKGVDVKYAIHPVAGRMPGHMNVLLAEANVPYPQLKEMDEINPDFERADVALVVGANDVTNPAARTPRLACLGHADPRRRPRQVDHRDQALDGSRLRRNRQRAVLESQDRDALRRREGRPVGPDGGGQGGLTAPAGAPTARHSRDQRPRPARAARRRRRGRSRGGRAARCRADGRRPGPRR